MSLWQVLDEETAEFMVRFYERYNEAGDVRSAFRETQREMAVLYEGQPYKWAGFILVE